MAFDFLKTGSKFANALPVIGPLVGTGLDFLFDSIAAKRERKFALQNWNMQNEYNSPVRALSRYKAAGMHPAYGGGISQGDAAPISNAATSVARASVPNMLEVLAQYQSLRNANLEEDRLKLINQGIATDNAAKVLAHMFSSDTYNTRRNELETRLWNLMRAGEILSNDATNSTELHMRGLNPRLLEHQLNKQRLDQDKQMFDINKEMQSILLQDARKGIRANDNIFFRMFGRLLEESPIFKQFKFK